MIFPTFLFRSWKNTDLLSIKYCFDIFYLEIILFKHQIKSYLHQLKQYLYKFFKTPNQSNTEQNQINFEPILKHNFNKNIDFKNQIHMHILNSESVPN